MAYSLIPTSLKVCQYAEHFLQHGKKLQAFRAIYPDEGISTQAYRGRSETFHKLGIVQDKIEELQEQAECSAAISWGITAKDVIGTLKEIAEMGMRPNHHGSRPQLGASVSAMVAIARICGFDTELSRDEKAIAIADRTPWSEIKCVNVKRSA